MDFSGNLVAFFTILRKEVVRFLRIWTQTLLPPVITQTLYFLIFGTFIGSQVSNIDGISYISFIVPGIIMMAVITSSFANTVGSFFGSKFQRNVEELLVSPTPNFVIIAGYTIGGALRGILVGTIVFIVSTVFVKPVVENFFFVALFIILTSILFSLGGLINAVFAKKFDDVAIFPTFVLTPLTYLGGVFYSIKDLPVFWQNVSRLNPILYMVDGFRYGFHGRSDINIWVDIMVLVFFTVVLLFISLYLFKKGIGLKK